MQKINTFFYGIGQGIKNIFRNRMFSLASIGTMAACLFLFGIFYIVLENFEHIVKSAETNVAVTVFFDEDMTEDAILAVGDKVRTRAEVHRVEYTSAETAWENYKSSKLSPELAESFGDDNPLKGSASLTVYLNDVSMQDSLVRYITMIDGVRKCNDAAAVADNLAGVNKAIAIVSGVIIAVLLFVAAFLISMTISTGISVRKQEISIMKLIGASNYFIRIPFIVEGILIGLIGAGVPLVILRVTYSKIVSGLGEKFASVFNLLSFLDVSEVMKTLVPVSLLIGVGIGFLGSRITVKRQLKRIEVN